MQDVEFEPITSQKTEERQPNILARGIVSFVFVLLFAIAESLLAIVALVQFLWMLFTGERNQALVDFGSAMGRWMGQVARFQAAETDRRPFPWSPWPTE